MMIDYAFILVKYYPDDKWSLDGDSYDGLTWLSNTSKPTKEELDSKWVEIEAYNKANEYKTKRAAKYPSIADQLDMLYHQGIDGWKAAITAVKQEYPKP